MTIREKFCKARRKLLKRTRTLNWISVRRNVYRYLRRLLFFVGCVRGLRQTEPARAVVALLLHIVVLRQRRNAQPLSAELPGLLKNNLPPSVILFHRTVDLDHSILQLADVADSFQVVRKHHDGKWTHHRILAEIEQRNAPAHVFYVKDFAGDASVFAYVLASLREGNAVRGGAECGEDQCDQ
jgi:hypothetical protein